jgi:hypothetical protein
MSFLLAWGVPITALISSSLLPHVWMVVIWPTALAWMSVACFANAIRCGRLHCWFTGVLFLLLAMLALLHGLDVVPLGANGWGWIGVATAVGGIVLWYGPERIWGKYTRSR